VRINEYMFVPVFSTVLNESQFAADRRNSSARSMQIAEAADIICMFDLVDAKLAKGLLKSVTFAAVDLTRIPSYSPEQTNMCSITERQSQLEANVEQLTATAVSSLQTPSSMVAEDVLKKLIVKLMNHSCCFRTN